MYIDGRNEEFIKECRRIDFSSESANREKNLVNLKNMLETINNERTVDMNKKVKRPVALIVAAAVTLCFSVAVYGQYGQDLWRVIKSFTVGDVGYEVVEDFREFIPVPAEVKGQVFDKDGIALDTIPEDGILYNANGEEIGLIFDSGKARVMTDEEFQSTLTPKEFEFYNFAEGVGYFVCDILTPEYLPEGYVFQKIEHYGPLRDKSKLEKGSNKYMVIYYGEGGNEITFKLRYLDGTYGIGFNAGKDIEQIIINGHEAVIDGNRLDVQIGSVFYQFFGNDNIGRDELIKIAESLKVYNL